MLNILLSLILTTQSNVWSRNDTLFFEYSGQADSVFFNCLDWRIKLNRKPATELWTGNQPIRNLRSFMAAYSFTNYKYGTEIKGDNQDWAGDSIRLTPRVKKLKGRLIRKKIRSNSLNEERDITIYVPPRYNSKTKYPVVYLADGNVVTQYALYVEYLIRQKQLPGIILVGVHSSRSSFDGKTYDPAKDRRSLEYNDGFHKFVKGDSIRFDRHLQFFCEEVPSFIESNYSVSAQRKDHVLFGYSNGASFTVSAGLKYPQVYANILSSSISWSLALEEPGWNASTAPYYHLASGTLEPTFLKTTDAWALILKHHRVAYSNTHYNSGHDTLMWRYFLLKSLEEILK
jgi:enterochelin esterase-like enzyme